MGAVRIQTPDKQGENIMDYRQEFVLIHLFILQIFSEEETHLHLEWPDSE